MAQSPLPDKAEKDEKAEGASSKMLRSQNGSESPTNMTLTGDMVKVPVYVTAMGAMGKS